MLRHGECSARELADPVVIVSSTMARARRGERCRGTASRFFFGGGAVANPADSYCKRLFAARNGGTSQVGASGECLRCGFAETAAQQRGMAAAVVRGFAAGKRDSAGRR